MSRVLVCLYLCNIDKTKKIILATSIELFNLHGLSRVTLRTIANKMKISQGNLNYHFSKREHIIEALYFQLVQRIDNNMSELHKSKGILQKLVNTSQTVMYIFFEYRFFLLDFIQIMRENKKIKANYSELTLRRERQFTSFFHLLIKNKLMRKEVLQKNINTSINAFRLQVIFGFPMLKSKILISQKKTF